MDGASIIDAITQTGAIAALAIWIAAERRDNQQLWSIIESLVQIRLRQVEKQEPTVTEDL